MVYLGQRVAEVWAPASVHCCIPCKLVVKGSAPPPPLVLPSPPPSAGGAGGRYTWGKLGEIYDDDGRPKDSKDPNYDSEEVTTSARSDL